MKSKVQRKLRLVVVGTLLVVFTPMFLTFLFYTFTPQGRKMQRRAVLVRVQSELSRMALAVEAFHDQANRWPTNLAELDAKPRHVHVEGGFKDVWGRDYVYNRPNGSAPGKIETFGADGNPSGNRFDGDAAVWIE